MSLITSINVCVREACTQLTIRETTGVYNVTTNVGGYGAPNKLTTDITSAILTVIDPSDVIYTINLLADGFPSSNTDFEYIIPMSELGNRTKIEDGYWQFIYTTIDNAGSPVTYIASKTSIFTCNSSCCVNTMLLDLDTDCDCDTSNTKKIQEYLKAKAFLDALKDHAYCGNLDKFTNVKLIIDKLCTKSNCKTCD